MVLHDTDSGVICIGQASHAWVSGQLARRWGNDEFDRPEPFDEVCLGAEQHDVGMAEWDLAPALNPETGRPRSFMEMPLLEHLGLWSAAPSKVLTQSPYAALIVSMHGRALYDRRDTMEPGTDESRAVARFVEEQTRFQQDLIANLGEPQERADRNQVLVWALDFLSLAPLLGWIPDTVPVPKRLGEPDAELEVKPAGPLALTVDPWPFGEDELRIRYQGRRLEGRYETDTELHAALREAPWTTITVTWSQS
jgi:Protein of unknown function (DUF3891)